MVIDMTVRTLRYVAAITLCLILAAGAVNAVSFTYADQAKRIKAGVIILPGAAMTGAGRPNPYIFYVMDQRTDLKPSGWDFYNPFAPSHVTADIAENRWKNTYRVGDVVDKSMGCYWEVPISLTLPEDLAQYDVLFLTGYNDAIYLNVKFSSRDKEKLRKFVDNGGVLWVDYERTSTNPIKQTVMDWMTFFIPTVYFKEGGAGMGVPAIVPMQTRFHSLLNRPFFLSQTDIQRLGGYGPTTTANTEYVVLGGFAANQFVPIVTRGGNTAICAAQYGSGYVVVTADNVGQAITNPVGVQVVPTQNNPNLERCGGMFNAAQPEDLRFAYNIVNWGSEHSTYQKNPRRTGSSFAEIGMSLVELWSYKATDEKAAGRKVTTVLPTDSSPAILDDMIFYVDGDNVLRAFDLSPIRDRDGDGDPDDGIRDYSLGAQCDTLWEVDLGGRSSPPTAAYAPIVDGEPAVPAVFVVSASGLVRGFNALEFTRTTTSMSGGPTPQPYFPGTDPLLKFNQFALNDPVAAPTYADGALYAGDGYGLLHVHDFLSGNKEWCHPRITGITPMGAPCAPSVGYFYDPTSGATEQVAYIATHGGTTDGTVRSYPIRVFNEVLTRQNTSATGALRLRTRSVNTFIQPGTFALYWSNSIAGDPNVVTGVTISSVPGEFLVTDPLAEGALNGGGVITADYQLQYVNDTLLPTNPNYYNTPQFRSIGIRHPAPSPNSDNAGISGSPAAGKNDILYFGTENGQFYAVKESGRGTNVYAPLTVKWRWYLRDPKVNEILTWTPTDGSCLGPKYVWTPKWRIVGAPALVGDMVYFVVNDDNHEGKGRSQGYLLAFKADPVFSITLDKEITPITPVTVMQADNMTNANPPPQYLAVAFTDLDKATPNTTVLVDFDTRKITFANFRARNGPELTASEDMIVSYQPFDPSLPLGTTPPNIEESHPAFATGARDQVNNLVWFIRIQPTILGVSTPLKITSSPTAMGNVIYFGCSGGYLCAVDVGKAGDPNVGTMAPLINRTAGGAIMNSAPSGVMMKYWLDTYAKGKPMTEDTTNDITASVAGSHGMLAVASAAGLSIMYNPVTLVADGNRLVEVNADGTLWTCDSTNSFAGANAEAQSGSGADKPVFGASNIPFNRPSVARKAYVGGTIVADTGNNRIVHIDKGGTAIWEIKDFVQFGSVESAALGLPYPMLAPGSPMELNKPTDVTCWMTMAPMDISNASSQMLPVYHYLIADSGNQRVVEIVNRYDMVTKMHRNYLVQVSKEAVVADPVNNPTVTSEGRALQFRTARIVGYGANGPALIVCAVANEDSSKPDMTGSGGALIAIDWTTGNILKGTVKSLPIEDPANPLITLVNPSFYNRQMVSSTATGMEYADVVIDARGVHVLNKVGNNPLTVRSYLNSEHFDYGEVTGNALTIPGLASGTHPRPFLPSYAQYLPNGHILVTNRATGLVYYWDKVRGQVATNPVTNQPLTRAMYGEIFELESAGPANPTGLIRVGGTGIWEGLHQPLSAERALY